MTDMQTVGGRVESGVDGPRLFHQPGGEARFIGHLVDQSTPSQLLNNVSHLKEIFQGSSGGMRRLRGVAFLFLLKKSDRSALFFRKFQLPLGFEQRDADTNR